MMIDSAENFGCESCWQNDAASANAAISDLDVESRLVSESHFIVTTRVCPHCSQRFITVFTETIDWVNSDDPQYMIIMPITEQETGMLNSEKDEVSETTLNSIGTGRRSLNIDYPSDGEKRIFWGSGIFVGPHD